MDDQRCSLDPSRSAPCTPKNTRKIDVNSAGEICFCLFFRCEMFWLVSCTFIFQFQVIWNLCLFFSPPRWPMIECPDSDKFFSLLANTQSRRLDDQRVSLPSLPGLQKEQETSTSGSDSSYLCYMVSKVQVSTVLQWNNAGSTRWGVLFFVNLCWLTPAALPIMHLQGSRMEDQRCSLPQIVTTGKQSALKDDSLCPARSASFNTSSDLERPRVREKPSEKQVYIIALYHSFSRNWVFPLMTHQLYTFPSRSSLNLTRTHF